MCLFLLLIRSTSLSLANGSDQLLERLICVLPKDPYQPWHSMDDAFDAKLWDIRKTTFLQTASQMYTNSIPNLVPQDVGIAGIGEDDSIILDGCRAANVRWKSFAPVAYTRRASWKRWLAQKMLRLGGKKGSIYELRMEQTLTLYLHQVLCSSPPSSSFSFPGPRSLVFCCSSTA